MIVNKCVMASQRTVPRTAACPISRVSRRHGLAGAYGQRACSRFGFISVLTPIGPACAEGLP